MADPTSFSPDSPRAAALPSADTRPLIPSLSPKAKQIALRIAAFAMILIGIAGTVAFICTMSNVGIFATRIGTCATVCTFIPTLLLGLNGADFLNRLDKEAYPV